MVKKILVVGGVIALSILLIVFGSIMSVILPNKSIIENCKNDTELQYNLPLPDLINSTVENDLYIYDYKFSPVNNLLTTYFIADTPDIDLVTYVVSVKPDETVNSQRTSTTGEYSYSVKWTIGGVTDTQMVIGQYPVLGQSRIVQTAPRGENDKSLTTHTSRQEYYAIDIQADLGADVVAFDDGVVVYTESRYGDYGCRRTEFISPSNQVRILHENGLESMYLHLKKGSISVNVGDEIKKGTLIAKVGNSGATILPHLHFQIGGEFESQFISVDSQFELKNGFLSSPRVSDFFNE